MSHAVLAEVASSRFLDKCQSALSYFPQFRQHFFLFANRFAVHWNRGYSAEQPRLDNYHGDMKSLQKGPRFRGLFEQMIRATDDPSFDDHQMPCEFARRPAVLTGSDFPLYCRHGIRGEKQPSLRLCKFLDNGAERFHGLTGIRTRNLQIGSPGLF